MSDKLGWALAGLAFVVGYVGWGGRGLVLALTVVVFWLLLQFSRTLRVLRAAAVRPIGHVASAVMLNARLSQGMRIVDIVKITRSLGRKVRDTPETLAWSDASDTCVEVEFADGLCVKWTLVRAAP